MKRLQNLNRYQQGVLLIVIAMVLIFSVIYPVTIARKGFLYKDTILVPSVEGGDTIYSAPIQGEMARFRVSSDKTVEFHYGEREYGPYTAIEDPTAIPRDNESRESMTGIELREGDEVIFRGGMFRTDDYRWLFDEDGDMEDIEVFATTSDGRILDRDGTIVDPMEPAVATILDLMEGPELTHKGHVAGWLTGVFISLLTVISIVFVDEIFRFHLLFRIRNPEQAEPSDWELAGRYITWTVLPIVALIVFILGLG